MILALDLGTRTGWAGALLKASENSEFSGVKEFRPGRHEGAGMNFLRFRAWLDELHTMNRLTAIYYEEVRRHLGTDAAHTYGAFWGTLTSWCQEHSVPFQGVPVGTIKKFATGKGNADKAAMIAAVRLRWKLVTDDNEADALALLHFVLTGGVK